MATITTPTSPHRDGGIGSGGNASHAVAAPISYHNLPNNNHNNPMIAAAIASSEASVILPPPSALNPIPSLSVAFRLDNQEQLLGLLATHPNSRNIHQSPDDFRQVLVFGTDHLRNLILRQVLQDPHNTTSKNNAQNKKGKQNKNWDPLYQFTLPKLLQTNVVSCQVLTKTEQDGVTCGPNNARDTPRATRRGVELPLAGVSATKGSTGTKSTTTTASSTGSLNPFATTKDIKSTNHPKDEDLYWSPQESLSQHVDVITYILRPWDVAQTMAVIRRIQLTANTTSKHVGSTNSESPHQQQYHHRIVYVPQITAMVSQILQDNGIAAMTNVTIISSLQLDVFPLETDLFSLEYDALLERVEGIPSPFITAVARSLLKLQDVTGPIRRIQALGSMAEEVLAKLLNLRVDEYMASSQVLGEGQCQPTEDEDDEQHSGDGNPQQGGSSNNNNTSHHSVVVSDSNNVTMLLLDRKLDMVTPMVTPLTYEGLLDEVVGIDCGFVKLDEQVIHPSEDWDEAERKKFHQQQKEQQSSNNPFEEDNGTVVANIPPKPVALGVHAGDTLYAEVRDQHVEKFGSFLQNQALALKESHSNFTSKGTKKDLNEIHQFVKQIPIFTQNLRSLTNHIHLAELIKATTEEAAFREQWNTERAMIEGEICYDILEELLYSNYPPYKFLRLLCLQSLTSGGIKANRYDIFRQSIVQVYGYQFLPVLHDLEKVGWIKRKDTMFLDATRSPFQSIKRNLILIHAEVDTVEPDDVSYVSSGYAPLSVRLVQSSMQGWSDKKDVLQEVFANAGPSGGGLLDIQQTLPPQDLPTTLQQQQQSGHAFTIESLGVYATKKKMSLGGNSRKKKPTLIVVYLGGITYMEIAALRFLSQRDTFPYHIIILTTQVLNGSKLLQQLG